MNTPPPPAAPSPFKGLTSSSSSSSSSSEAWPGPLSSPTTSIAPSTPNGPDVKSELAAGVLRADEPRRPRPVGAGAEGAAPKGEEEEGGGRDFDPDWDEMEAERC